MSRRLTQFIAPSGYISRSPLEHEIRCEYEAESRAAGLRLYDHRAGRRARQRPMLVRARGRGTGSRPAARPTVASSASSSGDPDLSDPDPPSRLTARHRAVASGWAVKRHAGLDQQLDDLLGDTPTEFPLPADKGGDDTR